MPATNSLNACNPQLNATVSASAGSGKTWLLISRIVRLLISGAEGSNIIALTFTRKAAAEMQIRLNQRLLEMATADDEELETLLEIIGCETDDQTKTIAAGLYETIMLSLYPIRIQTFHSFCQDILSRFPLEADIPPGFELCEDTSLLERQAWQTLFSEASNNTKTRQKDLSEQLDVILQFCNGPDNTQTALKSFLTHRSDWWAFTSGHNKPLAFACAQLASTLNIEPDYTTGSKTPEAAFFDADTDKQLAEFSDYLRVIALATSNKHADIIDDVRANDYDDTQKFSLLSFAFLTQKGEKLSQGRKHSAALEKKLGADTDRFLELHHLIADRILFLQEQAKRLLTLKINTAWYCVGQRFLELFQQLKKEQRLLDFTDLEWKCFQLLQQADNAHWVQYKIDQRIDHLLIDEFQDTNPTQWHLLSPILEEIAANPEQRARSIFLVGDEKQSIYSFRRANPALQAQASQWLAHNLNANATPLDFSRRSSPAVIDSVNAIFEQRDVMSIMSSYVHHDTHLKNLPGKVTVCDLFEEDETEEKEPVYFRNPLHQPREVSAKTVRQKEANFIARQIKQLVDKPSHITEGDSVRAAEYGDIMVLMRARTHIDIYEQAFKQYGIPFIGSKKGGLLDNLEIQDLICLLNTLVTPFNNLSFAQVLKSPIFDASDDDLILLAQQSGKHHWYERLLLLAAQSETTLSMPLQRAARLLPRWQALAEQLPVHDCLDKIFSESNLINRYMAANRQENRHRVAANCQRFLELSLETDSGRYPSITRFLQHLQHLKNYSDSPPEEPLSQTIESRVRLMTIHASKGLEAPIVFLADCNNVNANKNAYKGLVHWPADSQTPLNFQLQLSKDNTDAVTEKLQQKKLTEQAREDLNLLYVALTRAREQLYISGNANKKAKDSSWYQIVARGFEGIAEHDTLETNINCLSYLHLDYSNKQISRVIKPNVEAVESESIDPRLLAPFDSTTLQSRAKAFMLAPSLYNKEIQANGDADTANTSEQTGDLAKWRGIIIHRALELLCQQALYPATNEVVTSIQNRISADVAIQRPAYSSCVKDCIEEAVANFNHSELKTMFAPKMDAVTYNEMPLMYKTNTQAVYGIVDRVIKTDKDVLIIDYKSHQLTAEQTEAVAKEFTPQLNHYREGIQKLWPELTVNTAILFTHLQKLIFVD